MALGEKVKTKTPTAKETSITVLNGNGVTGSASNASYLLGQRGYPILTPPNGTPANAPPKDGAAFGYFRTTIYFDAHAAELARTRENLRHLPGCALPDRVEVTPNACDATGGANLIVVAIPSAYLRATLVALAERTPPGTAVLSVVKGIENVTFARPSQIVVETLGARSVAVLSGPSHAEELVRGLPASVVVGGDDEALNRAVRNRRPLLAESSVPRLARSSP